MPNSYVFNRLKGKKRYKKIKRKGFLFVFVLIFLFFMLIINFSDIISSLITNTASVFSSQKIEVPSYSVYAVSVYDFDNEFQANSYAKKVALEGGAGYVYHSGEYFVIASCYPLLTYAQEVQDNLKTIGYDARIVNLNVNQVSKVYKGKNLKLFNEAFSIFRSCYLELYELLIEFDKDKVEKNQINSLVAKYLAKISDIKSNFSQLKKEEDLNIKQHLLASINTTENILNELLYSNKSNIELSSQIKVALIDIVIINQQLCKNIA